MGRWLRGKGRVPEKEDKQGENKHWAGRKGGRTEGEREEGLRVGQE